MQFAFVNRVRSTAQPKTKGICQFCGDKMIPKCGPNKMWHWAHTPKRKCDPWWENETPWHREWKSYFPKEWRERIHEDPVANEKHIADVKTDTGRVLEFQNSPMPPDELHSRENFYGDMIWIVNGDKFKQNLILTPTSYKTWSLFRRVSTYEYSASGENQNNPTTNRVIWSVFISSKRKKIPVAKSTSTTSVTTSSLGNVRTRSGSNPKNQSTLTSAPKTSCFSSRSIKHTVIVTYGVFNTYPNNSSSNRMVACTGYPRTPSNKSVNRSGGVACLHAAKPRVGMLLATAAT